MSQLDLLVELGTEELPPKALTTLRDAFAGSVIEGLAAAGVPHGEVKTYAAPPSTGVHHQRSGDCPT